MSDFITDFNQLSVGRTYRIITNAGYFNKISRLISYVPGDFARFVDETGSVHLIHNKDYNSANPIKIYEMK